MILDQRHPQTGLPQVEESRAAGGLLKSLPKWLGALATPALQPEATWFPCYLSWTSNVLSRIACWKCGTDLAGWKPVIDAYGGLVKKGDRLCLWFREHDHATSTEAFIRWGCLTRVARFSALHCKDCHLTDADLPMLMAIFLSGHTQTHDQGWNQRKPMAYTKHDWATYLYRWSNGNHILCEPLGLNLQPKEPVVNLPTPGQPMMPSDYLQWTEALQGGQFYPGMVIEYWKPEIPPGWAKGPREGTILKL